MTKDVPANAIVAGNPAKVLRYVTEEVEDRIMSLTEKIPFLDLITPHQATGA